MSSGGRRRSRGREDLQTNAEINITPLLDVAFTLLVIFLITAPALLGGLEVNLPRGQVQPVTADDDMFIVSVDDDGLVYIGETSVTQDDFRDVFPELYQARSPSIVYIRGDSAAYYGGLYRVMATVNEVAGPDGVPWALIGEPLPPR